MASIFFYVHFHYLQKGETINDENYGKQHLSDEIIFLRNSMVANITIVAELLNFAEKMKKARRKS